MNVQLINEIQSAITVFKESRKMDFNCPLYSYEMTKLFHGIMNDLKKKIIPLGEMKHILGMYKFVTKESFFTSKEIENNIDIFQEEFIKKKEESFLAGKKILVVIGESHDFQESFFLEIIISTILKANGFNSALVEHNEEGLKNLLKNSYELMNGFHIEFFKNVLNMEVLAIDPLHDKNADDLLNIPRCNAINNEIAKNSEQNQMAIVGANHLKHIIDSKEINDNFIVMPLNVAFAKEKLPMELVESAPENLVPKGVIKLNFSNLIESFSINKLVDIYINMLPMIIGDEDFSEDAIFASDFTANYAQCKQFDNMPQAIEAIEYKFGPLIDAMDEL